MSDPALDREAIALFDRLLDVAEDERDIWIATNTVGRPDLRNRLQAMREGDRLAALRTGGAIEDVEQDPPPDRIGAYDIVALIGRGGMGAVYRGERATGDFAHVVAIKLIRPGLLAETLAERFAAERATLASLRHPNIAQLYDGGEVASGAPYLVMEFVDGLPLLEWVVAHAPTRLVRQRLFLDICAAVAFAHGRLIIHRDLTPSNVLVTHDGTIKLIDFGIARPTEIADGTSRGSRSSLTGLSLTPGYAAPERFTGVHATTAIDIYSLGRLLERLIPPKPGDRDLRAIIARAAADTPGDRYGTAEALRDDVVAWMEGLPVAAVEGGRRYAVGKFIGRHRLGVGLAALTTLLLVSAFAVTISAYARAEQARRAEAARFAELRGTVNYMLFDLNPRLARVVGTATARVSLAERAQRYLAALAASSRSDAELKREAARGFVALARIEGVPTQPNLGDVERGRADLAAAIALVSQDSSPAGLTIAGEALAFRALIEAHLDSDQNAAARTLARAEAVLGSVPPAGRRDEWFLARSQLRRSQLELATLQQQPDRLLALAARMEAEVGEWPAAIRNAPPAGLDRAFAKHYRGLERYFADRPHEGLPMFADAQRRLQALDIAVPNEPQVLALLAYNAYVAWGVATNAERPADADAFLATARITAARLLATEPRDDSVKTMAATIGSAEAQSLSDKGRHVDAIAAQREVIAQYAAVARAKDKPPTLNKLAIAHYTMGNLARAAGDRPLACASYRASLDIMARLDRRGALLGFVATHRDKLVHNLALCAATGPILRFEVM